MLNTKSRIPNRTSDLKKERSHGQSLFEVVFAIGLVSLILVALVGLSTASVRNSTFSKNSVLASQEAQTATEWLRSERDKNWISFVARASTSGTTWCLPSLVWTYMSVCDPANNAHFISGTIFQRQVLLTSKDAYGGDGIIDTVDVIATVSWTDSQGTHEIRNDTSLTDWRR